MAPNPRSYGPLHDQGLGAGERVAFHSRPWPYYAPCDHEKGRSLGVGAWLMVLHFSPIVVESTLKTCKFVTLRIRQRRNLFLSLPILSFFKTDSREMDKEA